MLSNAGEGPNILRVRRDEEMAMYDDLPQRWRRLIANAHLNYGIASFIQTAQMAMQAGMSERDFEFAIREHMYS